jgi:hypothetical protein
MDVFGGPVRRGGMKTVKPQILYVAAIIFLVCLILWVASLFFCYVSDDWHSPAADERSVPPSRDY